MANYNDLINVTFEDAVTYGTTDTTDILGVIMPYHWGPAGKVNIFNKQEFYDAYPEFVPPRVTIGDVYKPYYRIKSFFNNGGSRVAVYRPEIASEYFAEDNGAETPAITPIGGEVTGKYLVFKYPGLPNINASVKLKSGHIVNESGVWDVMLTNGIEYGQSGHVAYEWFSGQLTDPSGVTEMGESTYLPKILEQKSQYMQIVESTAAAAEFIPIPDTWTPTMPTGEGAPTIASVFCTSATLTPTMFLEYDETADKYNSSCFFTEGPITVPTQAPTRKNKFDINVLGTESIKVFNSFHTIGCNAGVAGAYSNIARQTHLNQIASAQAYGAYSGTLTSGLTFQNALDCMALGYVSVFNSNGSPQIFGTRNSFNVGHEGSYFARCNVSRVLASVLKNVLLQCVDVIHTDTAANAVSRKMFETNLNNIIGQYISTQDLQADSIAICNGSNNTDAQTQGGTILNIILALHFIGLVEKINIRVIATETGVTVNFA